MYPPPGKWQIIAPRVKRIHVLVTNPSPREEWAWADIRRILFDPGQSAWDAWRHLAKPYSDHRIDLNQYASLDSETMPEPKQEQKAGVMQCAPFEVFPAELLAMILDEDALAMEDLFALGLASPVLWLHVLEYIRADCNRDVAPLAGVGIACTGTHLVNFPASFAKDGLFANSICTPVPRLFDRPQELHWAPYTQYTPLEVNRNADWISAWHRVAGFAMGEAKSDGMYKQLVDVLFAPKEYDSESGWMLRNLTTKEYVRCEYVRSQHVVGQSMEYGCVLHPRADPIHIDDVLLMRICWSEPRGDKFDDLYRGKWAGHCFDIVPFKSSVAGAEGEIWKDCTYEVVKEASKWKKKQIMFDED